MYQKFGTIINSNKKYKYIYCDTIGLLLFLRDNLSYKKSFTHLLHTYRCKKCDIFNLVIEEYNINLKKNTYKYLLIYNETEIISSSRVYYNKIGIIQFVYTDKKYRNKQFSQKNIKKIIKLTTKYFKINKFELNVDINNPSAIKCYKNCGFVVKGNNSHKEYIMKISI
jgi:RimJ/RimL family protein N-acetyltransferase